MPDSPPGFRHDGPIVSVLTSEAIKTVVKTGGAPWPARNIAGMGRRAIGTLMLLATLSVIGVVVIQLLWLRQVSHYHREQVALNKEQATQLEKQFNDRVVMALTDVT